MMMAKAKKQADLREQLKAAIAESGLTTHAVAQGCGVAHPILYRFVMGQRDIKLETACKLAAYFQMTMTPPKTPKGA
jgi:plasmid maintenance system antidote protein VapI